MANKLNFTKVALDAIPLPEAGKRTEYCDIKQPNLRLRVAATGVKTFCIFKRVRGAGMERVTLARYPEMTIEQARKKTAEILGKFAEGDNPAEVRRALKVELTFAELFAEYAERHGKRKRSWRDDAQRYRDYLEKPLGKHKVGAITPPMISRILGDIEQRGMSTALFNGVRALASVVFSKGEEWGHTSHNPVRKVPTRKVVKRDRFLQNDELPRFFASLGEEPNHTVRDYFLVSLLTGARRANVLAMRWSEINFEEGIWRIARTKNDEPQNVTLTAEVLQILEERRVAAEDAEVYVFPGEGSTGHLVEPKKAWCRIFDRDELVRLTAMIERGGGQFKPLQDAKSGKEKYEPQEAKLERARNMARKLKCDIDGARMAHLRIHDLRRTLGSWQAKTGASLAIIGKSLNHKNHQTTAIYARLDLDPVRASVEKATAAIFKAAGMGGSDDDTAQGSLPAEAAG
jgi:integrase